MNYFKQMLNLWMPLDMLQTIINRRWEESYSLKDFYFVIKQIDDFTETYYNEIDKLEKFIVPKDRQTLLHLVMHLETLKTWILSIDKLSKEDYERTILTLPRNLIDELVENLREDTMLRAEKNVAWDSFTPKERKYQKLFKDLRKCCI